MQNAYQNPEAVFFNRIAKSVSAVVNHADDRFLPDAVRGIQDQELVPAFSGILCCQII
jgi:hypothetical protein